MLDLPIMLDLLNRLLFTSVLEPGPRYLIGFGVALLCFAIAIYFAKEVKNNPRLFTVLALFAGVWAANASVYDASELYNMNKADAFKLPDRAGDLSSFIMVFAGAILAREGKEHWFLNSSRLQVAALSLLVALVFPRQFQFQSQSPLDWITPQRWDLGLACSLSLVGFLALGLGAKAVVAKSSHFRTLVIALVVYAVADIGRTLELMIVTERRPMSDFFMFSFAAAKIVLTPMFCYIVLWHLRFGNEKSAEPSLARANQQGSQTA